jgi:seryl-tRNA synthetase
MTQDIKDLAAFMGEQFASVVKQAEKSDAEQIESVFKALDQAWQIYQLKMEECRAKRMEVINILGTVSLEENKAEQAYQDELIERMEILRQFRNAKLGTKVSDEAVATRAKNGMGKP